MVISSGVTLPEAAPGFEPGITDLQSVAPRSLPRRPDQTRRPQVFLARCKKEEEQWGISYARRTDALP